MASSYSPTLRIELIGTGDQSGLWGDTTNTNLGALIEQAITGVESIPMTDADYTLSALNGSVDEARNAVLLFTSVATLTASRNIIIPAVEKLYIVRNGTTGGQNLVVKTSGGTGYTVPNGMTAAVYCDGTNVAQQISYLNAPTLNTPTINTPTLTGTPIAPTAAAGTNTTQVATTAFVTTAVNNAFPSGTRLMFAQAAAPTGWTQVTSDEANNRMLRVVNTAGAGTGGSASPILNNVVPSHTHGYSGNTGGQSADHAHYTSGTTGTMNQNWVHSHGVSDPGHNHINMSNGQPGPGTSYQQVGNTFNGGYGNTFNSVSTNTTGISINAVDINHTHNWGNWSGGVNSNHTHGFSGTTDNGSSQTNWQPRYIDMILCSKN